MSHHIMSHDATSFHIMSCNNRPSRGPGPEPGQGQGGRIEGGKREGRGGKQTGKQGQTGKQAGRQAGTHRILQLPTPRASPANLLSSRRITPHLREDDQRDEEGGRERHRERKGTYKKIMSSAVLCCAALPQG